MTITVPVAIDNIGVKNFSELEKAIYGLSMQFGRGLLKNILETKDRQLLTERSSDRYRSKGLRRTCIKTLMGDVEYERRVYQDMESVENGRRKSVYLLDQELDVDRIGNISGEVCKLVAQSVCESSYRATARQVSELTGLQISPQAAWNLVQGMGEKLQTRHERNKELDEAHAGKGDVDSEILYEENDGEWIKLQGKARKQYGPSREMKVGIAYDGVTWEISKKGNKRRTLHNKVALAGFMPSSEFRALKEGLVASVFRKDEIMLRVVNGDGGSWTLPKQTEERICVLDEFHRNKKLKECVRDPEFAKLLSGLLYENRIDELLDCLEAQINSTMDEEERGKLQELQLYYTENQDVLKGYYERGIEIPPTREPGVIHHAQLGSMESNIFTLIGNRMKGGRECWSIRGGNNMAAILCAHHTTGLEHIFAPLPDVPHTEEEEWVDLGNPISAAKMPYTAGTGYEHPHNVSTTNLMKFLQGISTFRPMSSLPL